MSGQNIMKKLPLAVPALLLKKDSNSGAKTQRNRISPEIRVHAVKNVTP